MTRRRYVLATAIAASAFATSFVAVAIVDPLPRVIWNASASAPIGLYRIHPDRDPANGALVAVAPPARWSRWMAGRGYLPESVPLLKQVAAKAGQRVCRIGAVVSVDARPVASARARDGQGRPLPDWQGCRTLRAGELLLLNPAHSDSLDGRYFGPLPASAVIGRATPLHLRATSSPSSTPEAKEIGHADQYL
ncbi:S26 family signal peptidase [Sphingosinicella microcystinivorans]|uniref:S26 family signal peptidase n=1 Tax=Sphingosinicella microcystinivorans TaxID=335406 RepID=UPI0022F3A628|nr:S26 family signal peptidase [Sphingosinicella microcystinivorans]WBX82930.1 S26 family signal peptidase [Sphingosinicella microcystinivorans]